MLRKPSTSTRTIPVERVTLMMNRMPHCMSGGRQEPKQEQTAAVHHPPIQQQQDIGSPESTDQDATNPASSTNKNNRLDPGSPPKQQQLAGGGYSAVGEWKIVLNTRWSPNRQPDNNNMICNTKDLSALICDCGAYSGRCAITKKNIRSRMRVPYLQGRPSDRSPFFLV